MTEVSAVTHKLQKGISFQEIEKNKVNVTFDEGFKRTLFELEFSDNHETMFVRNYQEQYSIQRDRNKEDVQYLIRTLKENNDDLLKSLTAVTALKTHTPKPPNPLLLCEMHLEELQQIVKYVMDYIAHDYPINHYLKGNNSNYTMHLIEVGTLATAHGYSDKYPYVVTKVSPSGKTITVQEIEAVQKEDYDYFKNQSYDYNPDVKFGSEIKIRNTKRGWKSKVFEFTFGSARKYNDAGF